MIKRIFGIFDIKAEVYLNPFFETTTGQATRAFSDAINQPDSPFGRHPNDFSLRELGTFENESGVLVSHRQPIHVAEAIQFINIRKLRQDTDMFGSDSVDPKTGEIL